MPRECFEKMEHEKSPLYNYTAFCEEMVEDIRRDEKEKGDEVSGGGRRKIGKGA